MSKNVRKGLYVLVALLVIVSTLLVGCGSKATSTPAATEAATTAAPAATTAAPAATTAAPAATTAAAAGDPLAKYPDPSYPGVDLTKPLDWHQFSVAEGTSKEMVDTAKYKKAGPWKIGFSNGSMSHSWRVAMDQHLHWEVDKYGSQIQLIETDANNSPEKQTADIEDLLSQKIDLLLISAAVSDPLAPAVEKASATGIPIIQFDRKASVSEDKYVTMVEASNYRRGKIMMEWLAKTMNGKGNIVLLAGGAGASPAEDRLAGARDVLKNYPDIKVLDTQYSEWSPDKGKTIMEAWLQKYPDQINGIWSDSYLEGSGAIEAMVDAKVQIPPITGEDLNRGLKQWKTLKFTSLGVSHPTWVSAIALSVAVDTLNGKPVPKYLEIPDTTITPDKIDQFVKMELSDDMWTDILMSKKYWPK